MSPLQAPRPALSPEGRGIQRTHGTLSPIGGEGRVRGQVRERPSAHGPLSPIGGEGRVRGQVRERPRKYARDLRQSQTDAERKLWWRLRDRRLTGIKFRRQHPIGPFIADFCCTEAKLVVELDGSQHSVRRNSDAERTAFLERQGYRVLRFWDNEILTNIDGVLQRIALALRVNQSPSPCPLPRGERDVERGSRGSLQGPSPCSLPRGERDVEKGSRGSSQGPSSCPLPRGERDLEVPASSKESPPMNPSPASGERAAVRAEPLAPNGEGSAERIRGK
jgi:very-short-patch-repair endonuclease